ncbi:DUF4304 domain-containing protein [Phenylobacterium sp.]|uniref:DUF4304 domain-containing protein n=1 Tax=Phenylobacterium sp. TaxID=1871053 RepID=UPI0025F8F381|nr:DUF4304 domain-containing protein [Phenylobacterium sp.]MBX3485901.1 DUF4304 domain-containing protein [Phenylobacterium sp.]MCW5758218.1 DUF4304 domain-containing protein [Phenylobacterium sp.]
MTRLSYTKAIDRALEPLGFERSGKDWIRTRGDIWDCVNLQKSWVDGSVTVNLYAKDLETERILKSIACETVLGIRLFGERIGTLIDGHDRWWKNDPNGPAELAKAVREHGIPWFDRVRTLEDQATHWYYRTATAQPWRKPNLPALAVTLYRLGQAEEALALFEAPVPKTAIATLVTEGRCVQRWLKERVGEA